MVSLGVNSTGAFTNGPQREKDVFGVFNSIITKTVCKLLYTFEISGLYYDTCCLQTYKPVFSR